MYFHPLPRGYLSPPLPHLARASRRHCSSPARSQKCRLPPRNPRSASPAKSKRRFPDRRDSSSPSRIEGPPCGEIEVQLFSVAAVPVCLLLVSRPTHRRLGALYKSIWAAAVLAVCNQLASSTKRFIRSCFALSKRSGGWQRQRRRRRFGDVDENVESILRMIGEENEQAENEQDDSENSFKKSKISSLVKGFPDDYQYLHKHYKQSQFLFLVTTHQTM